MSRPLDQMSLAELWQLFPIVLVEHDDRWLQWYEAEADSVEALVPQAVRISHVGSTAIEGIWAKPIIDILVEVPTGCDLPNIAERLEAGGYTRMSEQDNRISLNKGYTPDGYADRVFHLHLRFTGDNDEICFRDHLNADPVLAREYEELKLALWKKFEHDRDAYTEAKGAFVREHTEAAKKDALATDE